MTDAHRYTGHRPPYDHRADAISEARYIADYLDGPSEDRPATIPPQNVIVEDWDADETPSEALLRLTEENARLARAVREYERREKEVDLWALEPAA